jgi:hypothetical protein
MPDSISSRSSTPASLSSFNENEFMEAIEFLGKFGIELVGTDKQTFEAILVFVGRLMEKNGDVTRIRDILHEAEREGIVAQKVLEE